MKVSFDIPDYLDSMDIIQDENAKLNISVEEGEIYLGANKEALISLAKQMIYMSNNNLPYGSHIHLDNFFCSNWNGNYSLIIEKKS